MRWDLMRCDVVQSYDVDIGTLFLTGFLSSAVFGTFLGMYVDMWGRRFGCLLFCVLEVSNPATPS